MDLKRLQQLAEAVGWKVSPTTNDPHAVHVHYPKGTPNYPYGGHCIVNITACAAHLEAEYRKLAERELASFKIEMKLRCPTFVPSCGTNRYQYFTRIADELAVKEPTMVERLKKEREHLKHEPGNRMGMVFDALIELYERKEK